MDIANWLQLSYWFSLITPPFRPVSFITALIALAVFFAGGIALKVLAKQKRKNPPLSRGLTRLARPFFFFSILGFFLLWFRQLGAAVLSARFWLAFIFAVAAVWFTLVLRGVLRTYKGEYERLQEKRKDEEYLPRK